MQDDLTLQAYHYHLPETRIAQHPSEKRDHSRLLVLNRGTGQLEHLQFHQISRLLTPADVLVINDTKVFPARLTGTKESGGKAEVFLLNYPLPMTGNDPESGPAATLSFSCQALIKTSRPPRPGTRIQLTGESFCTLVEHQSRGKWLIRLCVSVETLLDELLRKSGDIPLPPYIRRPTGTCADDANRYQTVYADQPGAVAAPTAGLHFTDELLREIQSKGVQVVPITLHVGYGTFAPVQEEQIANHTIHQEFVCISSRTAEVLNQAKRRGARIWAVGTTTTRALEFSGVDDGIVKPVEDWCDLYIMPGFDFKIVDNLITNFHLPRSSLLFLVAALCGRKRLLDCYQTAIEHDYRFYSYGDAMAIIK